ncbi:ABC transporter ATP-binding protein [Priestia megaterium]|uniref:ABC transporter ATP-binding protein n=1 Tax=Priestia megaterium TaxID=1404 RepID=UPI003EDE8D0D
MENVIDIKGVSKKYKDFHIEDLSFSVKKGFVTGFIGANGAGKSTTIKLIMNLIKKEKGNINIFGLDNQKHERDIKDRIGFVFDDNVFYEELSIKEMKNLVAPTYTHWDEELFRSYLERFELPTRLKIKKMSKGMKMKTSLAFALSHHADLIIMDEPTSGLDPVFRREILEILYDLMQDETKTVFFSTHITTDLDKIADYIVFIQNGTLIFHKEYHAIAEEYGIVKGSNDLLDERSPKEFVSIRKTSMGFEALSKNIKETESLYGDKVVIEKPSLEDIMYFTKRGKAHV